MVEAAHVIDGLSLPKFVVQERIDELKKVKVYDDDIWIVGYPRTGLTWLQQIVKLIFNEGEPDDRKITDAVPWLEITPTIVIETSTFEAFAPPADLSELPRPRAFKSHFPYSRMPCGIPNETPCKYIYIARNPKDVFVSLFWMMKQAYRPKLEWDTFWTAFNEGKLYYGNYMDHLLSWWPHKGDENVLLLKYEDVHRNLKRSISQVALFVGKELSDDQVSRIADITSFEKMKNDCTVNYSWDEAHTKDGEPTFLRKGVIGGWKNYLSAEQSKEMDAIVAERLKETGLKFDYE